MTLGLQSIPAVEGQALNNVLVGTFTDPGSDGTSADYSASVSWGDGETSTSAAGNVTIQPDPMQRGVLDILAGKPHAFSEEASLSFSVTVNDQGGASDKKSAAISVADNIPAITGTNLSHGHDPHDVSLTVNYSDTAQEGHNLLMNWGDGHYDTIYLGVAAAGSFIQEHRYRGADSSARHRLNIVATVVDNEGVISRPAAVPIQFNKGHDDKDGHGSSHNQRGDEQDGQTPAPDGISGPAVGVPGQALVYALGYSSSLPQAGTRFRVDWGDKTSQVVYPVSGMLVQHIYKATGAFTAQLIATDSSGNDTVLATKSVAISTVAFEPDSNDEDNLALVVGGSLQGNQIKIDPVSKSVDRREHEGDGQSDDQVRQLVVTIDGVAQTYGAGRGHRFDRIEVFTQAGTNTVTVSDRLRIPAELFGGSGRDTLIGGGGNNIVVGGSGIETLVGGKGRNLIIGGLGTSTLLGGPGSDILVGGATDYDMDQPALLAILRQWTERESYAKRVESVLGTGDRDDRDLYFLNSSTVYDASAQDTMTGNGGRNLFFAGAGDTITDLQKGEIRV